MSGHEFKLGEKPAPPVTLLHRTWVRRDTLNRIVQMLGPTDRQDCLALSNDPGLCMCLQKVGSIRGSRWQSALPACARAEAIAAHVGGAVHFFTEQKLPFEDHRFDLIVATGVMEYWRGSDEAFVAECHRILKTTGVLLIVTPCKKTWSLLQHARVWTGLASRERKLYTEGDLFLALKDGFDVQSNVYFQGGGVELLDIITSLLCTPISMAEDWTDPDIARRYRRNTLAYTVAYPLFALAALMDKLLSFGGRGFLMVSRAKRRLWSPRRTVRLNDGRSIAEATLTRKIATSKTYWDQHG